MTLKVKTVEFEVRTKAVTLPKAVSTAEELYSAASELLTAEIQVVHPSPLRLRLMGRNSFRNCFTCNDTSLYGTCTDSL